MGRLGWPDVLVVCPKCECLMFIVEQKYVDMNDYAGPSTQQQHVIKTDMGIDIVADPEVDPESMLVTINGRRVMTRVDGKKQAHVVNFRCEQRPMTSLWKALYEDAMQQRHDELTQNGKVGDFEPVVVNVEDPGPGHQETLLIKKCIGCAGQWAAAHNYYAVHMYNLDNGEVLPKNIHGFVKHPRGDQ